MFGRKEREETTLSRHRDAVARREQQVHDATVERRHLTRGQAIELAKHYLSEMLVRTKKYVAEEENVDGIIAWYAAQAGVGKKYATRRLAMTAMRSDKHFTDGVADAQWYRAGAELMCKLHDSLVLHVQEMDRLAGRRHGS